MARFATVKYQIPDKLNIFYLEIILIIRINI